MTITLDHCRYAPTWETLQTLLREVRNDPNGVLVKIDRADKGCDYRSCGEYSLGFQYGSSPNVILPITLHIKAT